MSGMTLEAIRARMHEVYEDRPADAKPNTALIARGPGWDLWSAQLRLKVAASKAADAEREQNQVMMPLDAEDCEW